MREHLLNRPLPSLCHPRSYLINCNQSHGITIMQSELKTQTGKLKDR